MTTIAPGAASGAPSDVPADSSTGQITPADMHDIQGNVVRGYRMPDARHFALRVTNGGGARRFLAGLLPDAGDDSPHVTAARDWGGSKPDYCLNIGFTWNGLRAVGVPISILSQFPTIFRNGPTGNATQIGDEGPSAPEQWLMGGPANPQVHILLSLFTNEARHPCMARWTSVLETLFARDGIEAIWRLDAHALPDGKVHFGYKDGIAQPRIKGVPGKQFPDMQPECEPGEFLLGRGYRNQYNGNFIGNLPPEMADNATYGAFRVLAQDVVGFEKFLTLASQRYNLSREMVAAKLMGRWRNGVPLVMSPDNYVPPIPAERLNDFDFGPSPEHPTYFDDATGLRCPVGAHVRRLNPRNALTMGKPNTRRIIRRGMPYGPPYDYLAQENPEGERGLVGYFICGDLDMQFEFLLSTWVNLDFSTTGIRGTREPILGAQPEYGGQFVLRTSDAQDPIVFDNLPRLVTTRGSVYCFLPGVAGLRFLAGA
jgi:deferrochelatase/peroxidase EfeB